MKITNAKLVQKNSLIGSFDLELKSGLIIRGAMLLEKEGRRWIGFPSKEWTKSDGSKGYFPLLEFASKEVGDNFKKQAVPLAENAIAEATAAPAATAAPSRQERQRGTWNGPADGPDDAMPF
ncbi:hypothetical protein [Methylocella sp.]|jgi:hypothetical protein|uniref:hypothetical protein n=1 Tax=Methylocella sp. TaxID=1978226 RepID=UPI003C1A6A0C